MIPRPHSELIKLWADGAEIEVKHSGSWIKDLRPSWSKFEDYRVKPITANLLKEIS